MSVEENKAVVRRYYEILNETSSGVPEAMESLREVFAEDYTNRSGTDGPWSVIMQGEPDPADFARWWETLEATRRFVIDDIIGEGDKVAIRLTQFKKGKAAANQVVVFRLSDGKIGDDWFCGRDLD